MTLLTFENVSKSFPLGRDGTLGLREVCLEVEPGELVAVLGGRGSGRTTLLRLAAGVDRPDAGVVRFDGRSLADKRDALLGREIAYAQPGFSLMAGERVIDHVADPALAKGMRLAAAHRQAYGMLRRVGALDCVDLRPRQLDRAEVARVLLARALMSEPRLLLLDEPTRGVESVSERDPILALIRSIADEGVAILMTIGESTGFAGATRALSLSDGELRGAIRPPEADVLPLRAREA